MTESYPRDLGSGQLAGRLESQDMHFKKKLTKALIRLQRFYLSWLTSCLLLKLEGLCLRSFTIPRLPNNFCSQCLVVQPDQWDRASDGKKRCLFDDALCNGSQVSIVALWGYLFFLCKIICI